MLEVSSFMTFIEKHTKSYFHLPKLAMVKDSLEQAYKAYALFEVFAYMDACAKSEHANKESQLCFDKSNPSHWFTSKKYV